MDVLDGSVAGNVDDLFGPVFAGVRVGSVPWVVGAPMDARDKSGTDEASACTTDG